jgi:uncharacterized repeat protein (TIGR01451 family)
MGCCKSKAFSCRYLMVSVIALLLAVLLVPSVSFAASKLGVAWKISLIAQPTNFEVTSGGAVDRYAVALTNTGGVSSSGPVVVTDTVPAGMTIVEGQGAQGGSGWSCGPGGGLVLTCSYSGVVGPLEGTTTLNIRVAVEGGASGRVLADTLVASGGGAPVAAASVSTIVGAAPPAFGFLDSSSLVTNAFGALDTQAGDRPLAMTLAFDFPQQEIGGKPNRPVKVPRAMRVDLPAGLTGSILATPQCKIVEVADTVRQFRRARNASRWSLFNSCL